MHKFGTFVLVLAFFLAFTGNAFATEEPNRGIQETRDMSDEGFGITYSDAGLATLRYETVMEQWKRKQSVLWENMSHEPFTINASAYTAAADECGKSDGITASGVKVEEHRTLACPPQYPFGTKIEIESMGTYVCEDRGGAIKGNHFDIYMQTKSEAFAFGRRNLLAQVVE